MSRNEETDIQNAILCELSGRDCLAWRNNVGKFRSIDNPQRIVSVGMGGMADIISVRALTITPQMVGKTVGIAVAHEVKTSTGKQKTNQQLWQKALEMRGGIYLISRSPEQAASQVADLPAIICGR